ncbi:MAG: glycine zipper domain-containing protein [Cyclobacteriaceae bacterium]|nr:glycine zipper domain-containing protein [Cyclobacteriaceae bacterium]
MKNINLLIAIILGVGGLFDSAYAQSNIAGPLDMYVFPAQGQDKDQQEFDEYQCYKWAKEQSGIDPINPPEVQAQEVDKGPDGSAMRGAAGGAAAGVAVGAIAGDAGKGAAIGATLGALRGVRNKAYKNAAKDQQAQQQAAQQEQAMMNSFKKAFAACMEGKGYTVK